MFSLIFKAIAWLSDKTGISKGLIGAGLITIALGSATAYHLDARHDAFENGRAEAVAECNITQLEEDLRIANERASNAEKRSQELATELDARQREVLEREAFIAGIEEQLEEFEDGRISDRTRAFIMLLEQRSRQYDQE